MIYEMLLEAPCDQAALKQALAQVFGFPPDQVLVVASLEEAPGDHPLLAEAGEAQGDFHCHLSVYPKDPRAGASNEALAQALCAALQTRALISDDSPDPYTWLLVNRTGEVMPVELDGDSFDQYEYRLLQGGPISKDAFEDGTKP